MKGAGFVTAGKRSRRASFQGRLYCPEVRTLRRWEAAVLAPFHVGPASTTDLAPVDGIRAAAVAMVVVFHAWGVAGAPFMVWAVPIVGVHLWVSGYMSLGYLG